MSTTPFSATMQTVAATACADGSLHCVLDSLGPIELGDGATVIPAAPLNRIRCARGRRVVEGEGEVLP